MKRFARTFLLLTGALLLASNLAQAADKPAHLFILSGQSNMVGMKPEAGFVPEAEKLFADGEVAFIKVSSGGKPIRLWVEEWNDIAAKHKLDSKSNGTVYYQPILEQFQKLLEKHTPIRPPSRSAGCRGNGTPRRSSALPTSMRCSS